MRMLLVLLRNIIKSFYLDIYNLMKHTHIHSYRADLHATYGKNVSIGKNTVVDETVTIGDYSYINRDSSVENCTIGKFCSISSGVYICPAEHDLKHITTHPIVISNRIRKKVVIANDVLICLNAIILQSVEIGNGAVVGAGAVVTKDVKPYEIVGGVPAEHIGWRFNKEKITCIENSKWWDWDEKKIKDNISFLSDESTIIK
ncbi:DapH/DapD/GlmU-related protein [Clostridium sp. FP1]|uniref:DapH/DapD/GlmU-related protein n=1 Tax=Clostridium sp. FP1 TaxID=2724076 RepID=UPI0013E90FD8|nr:DapH/DapD/GlmU-related protein [Clostridium sp. FP1]MBZ9636621.1 hypothetical protein [Clostridium sp. FP1]